MVNGASLDGRGLMGDQTDHLLKAWQAKHDYFIELQSRYVPLGTFPWIGKADRLLDAEALKLLDEAKSAEHQSWLAWRRGTDPGGK